MLFFTPTAKKSFDVAIPERWFFIGLLDKEVYLIFAINAGTYVAAAVKIYAHRIGNILHGRTHHLHLYLLFILLVGEYDLLYCNIGGFIALNLLSLDCKRTSLLFKIAQQLHIKSNCNSIGVTHNVVAEIQRTLKIGIKIVIEICTIVLLIKEEWVAISTR